MFEPCDCGSGKSYVGCCGRLHGGLPAASADELMRSRYSAFCRGNTSYLLKSWASETRPLVLDLDPDQVWTGLSVERTETTGPDSAIVRFSAQWRKGGTSGLLQETSRFRREGEGWVYIDGTVG
ncbi:MAG: YchJ family protein [Magnetovibrionaceae bacterium]